MTKVTAVWPLNLPARDVLQLPGSTTIAWAVFDADWYRAAYPEATAHLNDASPDMVLAFYFDSGQMLGHSPNMLFDEAWHRQAYPAMSALVEKGTFPSAFDAWCRGGCLERSPHWLFDELEYRRRNPELTNEFLAENDFVNGYDHYLSYGDAEGRTGHSLFDPNYYRENLDLVAADVESAIGPFSHCLRRLNRNDSEIRTSVYFDPVWYLERYPAVREAINVGAWRWALEHYLCNDTPTLFDPLPAFSEAWYLARYDDAEGDVRRREIRNGFQHFLRHGLPGLRTPSESFDLAWYAAQNDVQQDLAGELAADAFVHWITIGLPTGRSSVPPREAQVTEAQARTLFRRRSRTLSVLNARRPLRFETVGVPSLSVILIMHNQFELTMMALGSLRSNYAGDIELILIDSGSTDETRDILRYVRGVIHFRFAENIGFLVGCNAALQFATGDAVLYLNNDIELAPGAITAALSRLGTDPRIGAVGGMIIRSHGLVQEAGSIVYCDGSTLGYGRDASPLDPEVNFARDVEACSGAFLMARRSLLNELGGFDERFAPAYYEDTDLCLSMRHAGYRVVYDPAVVVFHLEFGSTAVAHVAEASISRHRHLFAGKHASYLADRPTRDPQFEVFARMADAKRMRVLFVEDTIPLRMIGSGFVRSNDILREMTSIGYFVTVYPINGSTFDVASVYADMPDGVEVMHDRSLEQLRGFLALRQGYYDVVWVSRTHNLAAVRAAFDKVGGNAGRIPTVILDTEAIESMRDAEHAVLEGRPFEFDTAIRSEFKDAAFCEKIVATTEAEAAVVRDLGFNDVTVIGHMRALKATPRPFTQRKGMLFVGAIHRMNSPNYDSLVWFIEEVLPLIDRELTWQTQLTVVGYISAGISLDRFRGHSRVTFRGPVTDLEPLYNSHRVFVAPTRIAAGAPYKIYEAASFGLPVVATNLLKWQLGWDHGLEILAVDSAEPEAFADQVVALYRDEALWLRLRDAALERLQQENSQEDYAAAIRTVLGPPRTDD